MNNCPRCGLPLRDRTPGRPKLLVPVQKILHALGEGFSVTDVARMHHISRASVYRIKENPSLWKDFNDPSSA